MRSYIEAKTNENPEQEVDEMSLSDVLEVVVGLEDVHILEEDSRDHTRDNEHDFPVELGFLN